MNKKTVKIFSFVLSALMLAGVMAGCKEPVDIASGNVSAVVQDFPVVVNEVTINTKPKKVAALSASIADVVIAIGYEGDLAVSTDDCTQPELKTLPKAAAGDSAAVVSAAPDLILANSVSDTERAAYDEAGIPVVIINSAQDREDFERLYTQVSSAINGAGSGYTKGMEAAQKVFTTLDDLSRIIPESQTVKTAAILLDEKSSAVTGDMIGNIALTYAGMTNVFQGAKGGTFEFEKLKVTSPDFIFCPEGMKAAIKKDGNLSTLDAVKQDKVFEVPMSYIMWEGRTVVTAATHFAGIAYPELLKESVSSATLPEHMTEESGTASEVSGTETSEAESSATESSATESSAVSSAAESSASSSTSSAATEYKALNPEDDGDDVLAMQERLSELGYLTEEYNGYYGEVTKTALSAFQKKNGIKETGVADVDTLKALFAEKAKKAG